MNLGNRQSARWLRSHARTALIGLSAVTVAICASVLSASPASASVSQPAVAMETSCQITINHKGDVLAKKCQSIPSSGSYAKRLAAVPDSSCGTPLITFWKDVNYTNSPTTVCGNDGTCDSTGYGISNVANLWVGIPRQVSSFQMLGSCRISGWWDGTSVAAYSGGYSGRKTGQNYSSLGAWNDRIGSMKLYSV